MRRAAKRPASAAAAIRVAPAKMPGAIAAALPAKLKPALATLFNRGPDGDDWLHEVKFDGYRILARIADGAVRLISRRTRDWTPRFKAIRRRAGSHMHVNSNVVNI